METQQSPAAPWGSGALAPVCCSPDRDENCGRASRRFTVISKVRIEFIGFEAKALVREYVFTVRESAGDAREFTLTIVNEAFQHQRVRYQDAPDVCSVKLRRELELFANHPPTTHYRISDADLDEYRSAHAPRKARSPFARKPVEDF